MYLFILFLCLFVYLNSYLTVYFVFFYCLFLYFYFVYLIVLGFARFLDATLRENRNQSKSDMPNFLSFHLLPNQYY